MDSLPGSFDYCVDICGIAGHLTFPSSITCVTIPAHTGERFTCMLSYGSGKLFPTITACRVAFLSGFVDLPLGLAEVALCHPRVHLSVSCNFGGMDPVSKIASFDLLEDLFDLCPVLLNFIYLIGSLLRYLLLGLGHHLLPSGVDSDPVVLDLLFLELCQLLLPANIPCQRFVGFQGSLVYVHIYFLPLLIGLLGLHPPRNIDQLVPQAGVPSSRRPKPLGSADKFSVLVFSFRALQHPPNLSCESDPGSSPHLGRLLSFEVEEFNCRTLNRCCNEVPLYGRVLPTLRKCNSVFPCFDVLVHELMEFLHVPTSDGAIANFLMLVVSALQLVLVLLGFSSDLLLHLFLHELSIVSRCLEFVGRSFE